MNSATVQSLKRGHSSNANDQPLFIVQPNNNEWGPTFDNVTIFYEFQRISVVNLI